MTDRVAFQGALGSSRRSRSQDSEALGIWPGEEYFIGRTLSGARQHGFDGSNCVGAARATPLPVPPDTGQGTGKRIVYSRLTSGLGRSTATEKVGAQHLVSGARTTTRSPKHECYSGRDTTGGTEGRSAAMFAVTPYGGRSASTAPAARRRHRLPDCEESDQTLRRLPAQDSARRPVHVGLTHQSARRLRSLISGVVEHGRTRLGGGR